MRHLEAEHISVVAAILMQRGPAMKPQIAVQRAIELQIEAKQQCQAHNRAIDESEQPDRT